MHTRNIFRALGPSCFALIATLAPAQTWTTLNNAPPAGVGLCLLLTDGGVMCQSGRAWYKLTPDATGSYLNGSWSSLASLPSTYNPDAFASAVLADGRLAIVGGEYNNGSFALSNMGAIYDPAANTWTAIGPPPSTGTPNHWQCIGDAPATVLADGRLLIGSKLYQDLAALNPATLTWSIISESGKIDGFNSEEGWTLLPDGSVFTVDVKNAPASERFLLTGATTGMWVSSGVTLQDLHTPTTSGTLNAPGCPPYNPPGEMGPALLRPNGTVFAIGADGYTGIYTPPAAGSTGTGTWAEGPAIPGLLNVQDGPAAALPSGNVLFGASPGEDGAGLRYYEFNGSSLVSVPAPTRGPNDATYFTSLLVLPTGQVMFVDGSTLVQLYTAAASPTYNPLWAPTITTVPSIIYNATTYQIGGTQFNGLNQGSAFGDESQNSSNYPLVRITNNSTGHVFYAKTHGHSTMGVATGAAIVSTNFDVPARIDAGPSLIQVVANGIPSVGVPITVASANIPTSTSVTTSPNPSTFGQLVTFTSTTTSIGGTPAGTVTFTEGSTVWASNVVVNSGKASFSTAALGVGSHIITATFSGSTGWGSSSGNSAPQVVNGATATAVASSPNPSTFGQSVTFTSTTTSTAGIPAGTVTFTEGPTVWASNVPVNGSGQASFSTAALGIGNHSITAAFTGSGGWLNSSGVASPQMVINSTGGSCLVSNLGAAGSFSILGLADPQHSGNGAQVTVQSPIAGPAIIGVGANTKLHLQNGVVLRNPVYEDPSATLQIDGGSSISGTQTKESFAGIQSAAVAASGAFGALTATQTFNQQIRNTTTIVGRGGQNVIAINNQVSLNNGQNLVISGGPNDTFIFNVAQGQNFQLQNGAGIVLEGVSAGQVVFNFPGNGANVGIQSNNSGTSNTSGIFIDLEGQINIQGGTHNSVFISGNQLQFSNSPTVNGVQCGSER